MKPGTTSLGQLFTDVLTQLVPRVGQHEDGGMKDTPERMARAWHEWTSGYNTDPSEFIKVFDAQYDVDQMVTVANIPVFSLCEHHGAPFFGVAHVSYIPAGRILGLSKMARIVNGYARRFQVQERLTSQIADLLAGSDLEPEGVGVQLRCQHTCMSSRGVRAHGTSTITTAVRGAMREDPSAKDEFLRFCASATGAGKTEL